MSEITAKPYLLRAIYEWCSDQGHTPYLAVRVNAQTRVPQGFVKNGEIVLNVSATATRHLKIDNDWIQFSARFNGSSHEVSVPMSAVAGIFARETGYGFAFNVQGEVVIPGGTQQPAGAGAGGNGLAAVSAPAPVAAPAPSAPALPASPQPRGGSAGVGRSGSGASAPSGPGRPRGKPKLQVIK